MKRLLLAAHRWLGLTLGVVLMSSGLSGALLVLAKPLERAWNRALHEARAPGTDARAIDEALRRLRAEFAREELVVRLPRGEGASLQVHVRGGWNGQVFVDPSDGAELGRRGEAQGFFNLLFEWHSALLSEGAGKAVLFAAGLAGLVLAILGLALWWPARGASWRGALRVGWGGNAARVTLDLHRVGGVLLALALLVSLASGMYMAWRPLSAWVDGLAGFRPAAPPAVGALPGNGRAPLSALIAAAERALPGGRTVIVVLPAAPERAVRVRERLDDEVHPNGLSSVWLHPQTAEVLRVVPWREGGPGVLGFEYLYPLHIGELGGAAHRALVALTGLALFLLGASGAWLWWRRGRRVA